MTGNKGEWSEFYTFIKLLADKKIVGANENLETDQNLFFPIISILRNEKSVSHEYRLNEDGNVYISAGGVQISIYNNRDLSEKALNIFEAIKTGSNTFAIPSASQLMRDLHVTSLKAGNSKKEDITLKIHDYNTQSEQIAGFSIKSMLGSPATLLNASGATNFNYELEGCSAEIMNEANSITTKSKVKDRVKYLTNKNCTFLFKKISSDVFTENLRVIESTLPLILSEYLLAYYSDKGSILSELSENVLSHSALLQQLGLSEVAYTHKIKTFLHAIALGMVPASRWNGEIRAHGGYIFVREDGEIVCYHVFNADQFRNYLYKNVKFDTPGTNRHSHGIIYVNDGKFYIDLNIQVRFIK